MDVKVTRTIEPPTMSDTPGFRWLDLNVKKGEEEEYTVTINSAPDIELVSRDDLDKSVKEGILHTLEELDRLDERKSRKEKNRHRDELGTKMEQGTGQDMGETSI